MKRSVSTFALAALLAGSVPAWAYAPNHWQQVLCVRDRGGCLQTRDAGVPDDSDIARIDAQCRGQTRYTGPVVELDAVFSACDVPANWAQSNRALIQVLRAEAGGNDLEALARMFEDRRLISGPTVADRLDSVLESMAHPDIPGVRQCQLFKAVGFNVKFQDHFEGSNDQGGHFMTAVGMAYDPGAASATRYGVSVRDLLSVSDAVSDLDFVLRLVVAHERAPDPANDADHLTKIVAFRKQWENARPIDIRAFQEALTVLNESVDLRMDAIEPILRRIPINPAWPGNSYEDIRLTAAGFHLGQLIRDGRLGSPRAVAAWIRTNLR